MFLSKRLSSSKRTHYFLSDGWLPDSKADKVLTSTTRWVKLPLSSMGSRFVETDVFRFSYTPENEHGSRFTLKSQWKRKKSEPKPPWIWVPSRENVPCLKNRPQCMNSAVRTVGAWIQPFFVQGVWLVLFCWARNSHGNNQPFWVKESIKLGVG